MQAVPQRKFSLQENDLWLANNLQIFFKIEFLSSSRSYPEAKERNKPKII